MGHGDGGRGDFKNRTKDTAEELRHYSERFLGNNSIKVFMAELNRRTLCLHDGVNNDTRIALSVNVAKLLRFYIQATQV